MSLLLARVSASPAEGARLTEDVKQAFSLYIVTGVNFLFQLIDLPDISFDNSEYP